MANCTNPEFASSNKWLAEYAGGKNSSAGPQHLLATIKWQLSYSRFFASQDCL